MPALQSISIKPACLLLQVLTEYAPLHAAALRWHGSGPSIQVTAAGWMAWRGRAPMAVGWM